MISYSVNTKHNGSNDDVVAVLKDLKNTINNASGDVYNFPNITYDDGSNVSNAVKDLIHAAKVERRK